MSQDLAPYTSNKDLLHQALVAAGAQFVRGKYLCPFHEDKNPSGSIHEHDGKWSFKCFACGAKGDYFDILAHTANRPVDDIIKETLRRDNPPEPKPREKEKPKQKHLWPDLDAIVAFAEKTLNGRCTQRYEYTNPDTRGLDVCVLRVEKPDGSKEFWQAYPVEGGYHIGLPPNQARPLYNRARLRKANTIVLVEGEKCVHALHNAGITATTSLGGANGTDRADWSPLAGKHVILWPDNDEPGLTYVQNAAAQLEKLDRPPTIVLLNPKVFALPEKGDAADYVARESEQGRTPDQIRARLLELFEGGQRHGPSAEVIARVDQIIDGTYVAIPWIFPMISRQTNALQPGTVTIVGGTPGSSKSWFVLQNAMHWHDEGHSIAILMLEENRAYWLRRAMVIKTGNSDHLDQHWIQKHPEDARAAARFHAPWMDNFGRCIKVVENIYTMMEHVVKWVCEEAAKRTRIIIVDPITLAVINGDLFREELKFLSEMKSAIDAAGSSLILVTHPKQGQLPINLNAMAGSAAYQRAVQTVLWMEHLDEDQEMEVLRPKVTFGAPTVEECTVHCNRRLHLLKTRNASGHGLKLAYHFYGKTVSFTEQGLIKKSTAKNRAGAGV